MKKIMISLSFILYLVVFKEVGEVSAETEYVPQNRPPTIMELAFLREIGPIILNTMEKHGDAQLFTSGRMEKIIRNEQNDFYDVTIRVVGYEGPINPPYKLIRITFRFPGENYTKYSIVQYKHRNITPDEFNKLSKYVDREDD
ncbi:hypothetical protein [Priestia megaterium]